MEIKKIEDLAKILKQNGLTKLELSEGECHLVLESGGKPATMQPVVEEIPVEPVAEVKMPEVVVEAPKTEGYVQKAPLVGTVYLAAKAGEAPFISVGDTVKKGDVICIVESMKMFNNIEAEVDGTVLEICVNNGQIVEFAQNLVCIQEG
ncbi:acetyl-CoA carboxylase biotin carboxyl carrier protein [Chakrabartyella piscis]|uniref:acetyl-CoA carboxylase biotin carboxyl carrier protein n=1 Tax=Chakrabartyella piscis TaxID=2918914 RepID=UPI0029583E75|nr:acetyl-CoA carboxylase biotin carboxyl carrier protein [Chakrabartyella piscis]